MGTVFPICSTHSAVEVSPVSPSPSRRGVHRVELTVPSGVHQRVRDSAVQDLPLPAALRLGGGDLAGTVS